MPFNKKAYMREYMREYMRKRRAEDPDYNQKSREKLLRRKLGALMDEMTVSDLEKILQQKRERLAAAQEGRRE